MSIWALLLGIPFVIAGWNNATRRQNERHAPTEAAQRFVQRDDERQAAPAHRVRFEDSGSIDPYTGEVLR